MLKASIETLTNENKELKKSIEKSNEDNIVLKQEMDAINVFFLSFFLFDIFPDILTVIFNFLFFINIFLAL